MFPNVGSRGGFLTGFTTHTVLGNLDVTGVVTATAGIVANVTGNVVGNTTGTHIGAVTGDVTGSGSSSFDTVNLTTVNIGGLITEGVTTPATLTGDVTDYSSSGAAPVCRSASNASHTIISRSGASLQRQRRHNVGAQNIVLRHDDGVNGTATLRYKLRGAANFTLIPDASCDEWYDPTTARWRVSQL